MMAPRGERGRHFQRGDIVRLKPGFDRTLEGMATRRAGLPLKEGILFEVLDWTQGEIDIVLTLREVRVFYLAGNKHVTPNASGFFHYVSKRFELV